MPKFRLGQISFQLAILFLSNLTPFMSNSLASYVRLGQTEDTWNTEHYISLQTPTIKGPCCFLGLETLPLLLSIGWFQERIRAWFYNRTKINWGPYGRLKCQISPLVNYRQNQTNRQCQLLLYTNCLHFHICSVRKVLLSSYTPLILTPCDGISANKFFSIVKTRFKLIRWSSFIDRLVFFWNCVGLLENRLN